ncbi:hypothetical protein GCM10010191_29930 [Actinomadura vinacea]|uniref:DUF4129 domain-containing protein n=1 Tax=Actinomadura vinacea TaxID=115336 RepID=A0ABP5W503_9ACTN
MSRAITHAQARVPWAMTAAMACGAAQSAVRATHHPGKDASDAFTAYAIPRPVPLIMEEFGEGFIARPAGRDALAVLALLGIAGILIFQARETRIVRGEARRSAIADLLKMAMDDPALDEAWGPVPEDEDRKARRQLMYINMILSEWQMSFETKAMGETRLRAISRELFSGSPGRAFWEAARDVRIRTSDTRRARRFHLILEEEYNRAPAPSAGQGPEPRSRGPRWQRPLLAAGTAAAVVVIPLARRARLWPW